MLGFLDTIFLKLEGKEPSKKGAKRQHGQEPVNSLVPNYDTIRKPVEPDRIGRKVLNGQSTGGGTLAGKGIAGNEKRGIKREPGKKPLLARSVGLGSLLYHYLVDKGKAGLDGWKDDKEKFKLELLNDIKTFLFGKWEKPWEPGLVFNSKNIVIGGFRGYNGNTFKNAANILTLKENAGRSPYFIALNRLKKEGGQILDKEKICSVMSFIPIKEDKEVKESPVKYMLPMVHDVINLDYVSGIKKPKYKEVEFKELELNEYVENFLKVLKATRRVPKIFHDQADNAFYRSNPPLYTTDEIRIVQVNQFKQINSYYSVLFHEIIHSTKNPKRLGRGTEKTNKLPYANEELVAEMGAMILCAELGLEYTRQNSLTYLKGWLNQVKGDKDNALLESYAYACDAVEYLTKGVNFDKLVPKSMRERAKETGMPGGDPTPEPGGDTPPEPEQPVKKEVEEKMTLDQSKTKKQPRKKKPGIRAKVLDKTVKATVSQAVTDLRTLPRYKHIGVMVGTVIYNEFKDDLNKTVRVYDYEKFKKAMFEQAQGIALVVYNLTIRSWGNYDLYELTDFGREFIASVKGRLSTLHGKKYMNPLFGLAGINEVNEQFNQELDLLINGELPKNHVFYLGETPKDLHDTGIPYLPIEMQAQRLNMKAKAGHHVFDLNTLKDLPLHVQNPMAIFQSLRREKSKVLFIELQNKGVNFIVIIEAGGSSKSRFLSVNSIRSIYPKDNIKDVLRWVVEYELLQKVSQKQKFLDWLNKQQYKSADVKKLIKECTNIIQNFENRNTPLNEVKAPGNNFGFAGIDQVKKPKTYRLNGALGQFLGEYERLNYSIVLRGEKGAGKSRLLYQIINAFASKGHKTAILSLEMAPGGSVTNNYVKEYVKPSNRKNIEISAFPANYDELSKICKLYDVVAVDSWTKLRGIEQADFDRS